MQVATSRHNLPQSLTSFIGREQEIADAVQLLRANRLLTVTGTGGVGKTRLACEVSSGLLDEFPGGVWLVELAALAVPILVPRTVALALGVPEAPDLPVTQTLIEHLRERRALLVLDNCEHLLDACAALAETLLRACPDLRVLTTSRQPLGITCETTYRVPSLSLAAPATVSPGCAQLAALPIAPSEAVRLFVERACAVVPRFSLTMENMKAIETICQRLDGIPLAIELAAARVSVLSPEQIADRLDDRFRLLTGGSRTALMRYRTLRALIDWSHDLLDEPEQVLWRRLSVFAGGWTLNAAEAVCAGGEIAAEDIFDLMCGLVSKSIVQAETEHGEVRYSMLESLREYAAEHLGAGEERERLRERQCAWYLALAEEAEEHLSGPQSVIWLDRLALERDNVCRSLSWCAERGEAEAGLRLGGALARFWLVRGPYAEARAMLAHLLGLPDAHLRSETMLKARLKTLLVAGRLAIRQDDTVSARSQYREALSIGRELGDRLGVAVALFSLACADGRRGDYAAAERAFEEALGVFESLNERGWVAKAHQELGVAAYFQGKLETARHHYQTSLTAYTALGDEPGIVAMLNDLGEVALRQGDLGRAQRLLAESLTLARRTGDRERMAMVLAALAGVAAAQDQPTRALQLAAAAAALNEMAGQRNSPAYHAMVERWLEPARRTLDAEACALAQAAGRAMPLDEVIEYALAFEVPAPVVAAHDSTVVPISMGRRPDSRQMLHGPSAPVTTLTPREREVAALIASGYSNRQIAAELVITEGTAANHVKHILARLVLESRVQIATWAMTHGLHRPHASRPA